MKAQAMVMPVKYFFDNDGNPLAFGKIYTYQAGTTTDKVTYTTENGDIANTNPVILNGEGYASIYLDGSYNIVVDDQNDNNIWTEDPVSSNVASEWVGCETPTYISTTSFKITGNVTSTYQVGRRVRIDNNVADFSYSDIDSVSFSAGETTVTIVDSVVDVGVIGACVSIISKNSISQKNILDYQTVEGDSNSAVESKQLKIGYTINAEERSSGKAGGAIWDVIASGVTAGVDLPNGIDILSSKGITGVAIKLRITDLMNWAQFGVTYDGTDESTIVQRACDVAINLVGKGRNSSTIGLNTQITTTRDVEISKSSFKALSIMDAMFDCPTVVNIHDNKFDGDNKAESAIRSRVNCDIYDNTIFNIESSSTNLAAGIYATLTSANKGSINIRDNDIDSVVHTETGGVIGSNEGSSRSILVKLFVTCTRCSVDIANNICIDTYGREGDVITTSDENWTGNNIISVNDNNILGFNRRGVKVQSSNTTVSANNIEDIIDTDPRAINGKYSVEIASNDATDVHIFDNTMKCMSLSGAVNIFRAINSSVHDNTITVDRDSALSLQPVVFQYGWNVKCTINDNVAETNHFVVMSDSGTVAADQGITVRDNEITSTSLTGPVAASATFLNISADSSNSNLLFNTIKGDVEDFVITSKVLTNFRVTRNDIIATNGKGRIVNATVGAHVNCLALNNTADGVNQPFPATLTGWKKYGNYHPTHTANVNDQDLLVERGAAIADAAGGATVDTEARAVQALILAELRVKNIIAP